MFLDVPIFRSRKLCRATAVETHICFDFQGGKFKSYLIPGSSVFTFGLRKLAYSISNVLHTTLPLKSDYAKDLFYKIASLKCQKSHCLRLLFIHDNGLNAFKVGPDKLPKDFMQAVEHTVGDLLSITIIT